MQTKTFDTVVKALGARLLKFVISTGAVDRDNDTIDPRGWRLDAFRRNPIVLWSHDHRALPVARATDVGVEGDALVATAEFPTTDLYPFGAQVYEMLVAGFLRATSVGFRALRFAQNSTRGGTDFLEQELLEFSICSVPANAEALARDVPDVAAVKSWLRGDGVARTRSDDTEMTFEIADDAPVEFDDTVLRWRAELAARSRLKNPAQLAGMVDVDPSDVAAAIRTAFPRIFAQVIAREVRRGLNQARGRLD